MENTEIGRCESIAMLSNHLSTLHEVAWLLKVDKARVRARITDGQLGAFKFGRDWRVAVKDLERSAKAHPNRAP